MKSILISLMIVIGGPNWLPITSSLNVDTKFNSLSKTDSMFVFNVLERDKPSKHHIIKLDSLLILSTFVETKRTYNSIKLFGRKGTLEKVYLVKEGFIENYYEIVNGDTIIYEEE